ncbi:MAG TPA: VWA domain-containing protein [Blastocatellia bacterium]|nr:VWA domain-containing protein [Blastocatellia bacterium]
MRKPLLSPILLIFLLVTSSAAPQSVEQPSSAKQQRKNFGSSLKTLKWDPKKRRAVEVDGKERKGGADVQSDDALRLETLLVTFDVAVTNGLSSQPVGGLTKEDFIVFDNGRQQPISFFAPGSDANKPRSIILIIDYSSSINAYFDTSIKAAQRLVEQLSPTDTISVISDDVKLLSGPTTDKKQIIKALEHLNWKFRDHERGQSKQFSALFAAIRELVDDRNRRTIVIFQSDGDEAGRLKNTPLTGIFGGSPEFGFPEIVTAAEKAGITIYGVIPGECILDLPYSEVHKIAQRTMARARGVDRTTPTEEAWISLISAGQSATEHIVGMTGGQKWYLTEPQQADRIYAEILADINQRYLIGYYPTVSGYEGQRREVQIGVLGHPEYKMRGRLGYYMPDSNRMTPKD